MELQPAATPAKAQVSQGYFNRPIELRTSATQQIWENVHGVLPRAFYQAAVNIRFLKDKQEADELDAKIKSYLGTLSDEIERQVTECDAIMERTGTPPITGNMAARQEVVKVTSPRLNRALNLLDRIDVLVNQFDALWLAEEDGFDDDAHTRRIMSIQRFAVRIFRKIADDVMRAVREAREGSDEVRAREDKKGHELAVPRASFDRALGALGATAGEGGSGGVNGNPARPAEGGAQGAFVQNDGPDAVPVAPVRKKRAGGRAVVHSSGDTGPVSEASEQPGAGPVEAGAELQRRLRDTLRPQASEA